MFDWNSRPKPVPLAGSIFNVLPAAPSMGQQDTTSYMARAQAAVSQYDSLLKRISDIADDAARNDLLSWISTSSVPGTPAERRNIVAADMANPGAVGLDVMTKRLGDLEEMNKTLEAKVKTAEQGSASTKNPQEPGLVKRSGVFTPTGIALGAVSVLGLLVVPLMLRER